MEVFREKFSGKLICNKRTSLFVKLYISFILHQKMLSCLVNLKVFDLYSNTRRFKAHYFRQQHWLSLSLRQHSMKTIHCWRSFEPKAPYPDQVIKIMSAKLKQREQLLLKRPWQTPLQHWLFQSLRQRQHFWSDKLWWDPRMSSDKLGSDPRMSFD